MLALELGHVVRRHGMQRIVRAAGIGLTVSLLLGGLGDGAQELLSAAAGLGGLKFDRDEERQADEYAAGVMREAGLDPGALARFLGRMAEHPIPSFLTTHPDPEERFRTLSALARTGDSGPRPDLPPPEGLKEPCETP